MITNAYPIPSCNHDIFLRVSSIIDDKVLTFKFTAQGVDASEKIESRMKPSPSRKN